MQFQKSVRIEGLFLRCHPQLFGIVTLVARRIEHFRVFGAIGLFLNSLQKGDSLIHKNPLTACQLVLSHRRVTRSDVSFQTK